MKTKKENKKKSPITRGTNVLTIDSGGAVASVACSNQRTNLKGKTMLGKSIFLYRIADRVRFGRHESDR